MGLIENVYKGSVLTQQTPKLHKARTWGASHDEPHQASTSPWKMKKPKYNNGTVRLWDRGETQRGGRWQPRNHLRDKEHLRT